MPEPEQQVQANGDPGPPRLLNWIVAAVLGTFTELLADALRQFAADVKGPMVHVDFQAVLLIVLGIAIIVVPIVLLSKASSILVDQRAERVVFIVSLLVSAFLMPPLSWFAKLASGH